MCYKNNIVFLIVFLNVCMLTTCGRVRRVIGAFEVECGTQPLVGFIRFQEQGSNLICGSTIISTRYALTAAHCLLPKKQYILQLNNYCNNSDDTPLQAIVEEIILHDLYDPVTKAHDIALLRLNQVDDITRITQNLLPKSSFGISGDCTIYGYGSRDLRTMETSEKLLAGKLSIVSLDACVKALGVFAAPKYDDGMICAIGDGIDACQGDSGSPLICDGKIEGISSYGMSCAVPGLPGVYTSIGPHLQWILDVIQNEGS